MAPKKAPEEFTVGEVRCSITNDDKITVGLGRSNPLSSKTVVVTKRKHETKEEAVSRRLAQMASDSIEAGWLVVRGRWYECVQRSPRGYKLLKESRLILANTLIRLPGICFKGGAPGKYPRGSSETETPRRGGLHILEEDMYNELRESV